MHSGMLDKRIEIQLLTQDQSTFGEPSQTWATVATVNANIRPLVGREYFASQQHESQITHDVTIRYRRNIKPKMRIFYSGRYFEIHAVMDPDERREWLYLKCREVVF